MVQSFLHKVAAQDGWQQEIIQTMHNDYEERRRLNTDAFALPAVEMRKTLIYEDLQCFTSGLLYWVRFRELEHRPEKIEQAYERTFEWIFSTSPNNPWSDFVKWAEGDSEPLYWITGKPASGKSTLMKFIYSHERTHQLLHQWAKRRKLIVSAFYFWNSGSELQMSEEGLARTLLYETIRQEPGLWEIAFPHKMEEFILFGNPWHKPITWEEIMSAFRHLVEEVGDEHKLFFFIDGLDEYSGDHDKLIAMIQRFVSPNVKTCVSSRPWIVFEDGFHQRPSLRLEDLTYNDIKHYVSSRLSQNRGFAQLEILNQQYAANLIKNVVMKASGVFLWVHLVTDSLMDGLSGGERLEELQARLDDLPPDLEHLFWNILARLGGFHLKRASEMFQIFRASIGQLTLLMFSYADDADPDIASKHAYGALSPEQTHARADIMRRRLTACCKGLLESKPTAMPLAHTEIGYLHRTVKDYVERPEIWSKFLALTDPDFNPYFRLCNARIIELRTRPMGFFRAQDSGKEFWAIVTHAIQYALLADPTCTEGFQAKLFNALDFAASYLANREEEGSIPYTQGIANKLNVPSIHWTAVEERCSLNRSFLHLAIQSCLFEYVREAASPFYGAEPAELSHGLLVAVSQNQKDTDLPLPKPPRGAAARHPMDLVPLLLSRGADPNLPIRDALKYTFGQPEAFSPWQVFLLRLGLMNPRTPRAPGFDPDVYLRNQELQILEARRLDNPNPPPILPAPYHSSTPTIHQSRSEIAPASLLVIAKSFLEHGADPSLVGREHGREISAWAKRKLGERRARGILSVVFKPRKS